MVESQLLAQIVLIERVSTVVDVHDVGCLECRLNTKKLRSEHSVRRRPNEETTIHRSLFATAPQTLIGCWSHDHGRSFDKLGF